MISLSRKFGFFIRLRPKTTGLPVDEGRYEYVTRVQFVVSFGGFRSISQADKPAVALAKAGMGYHGFSRGAPLRSSARRNLQIGTGSTKFFWAEKIPKTPLRGFSAVGEFLFLELIRVFGCPVRRRLGFEEGLCRLYELFTFVKSSYKRAFFF